MRNPIMLALALASSFLALNSLDTHAAQAYPNRTIKLIVPFTPGGSTDFVARLIGEKLTERTGQSIVIENKPGAGGSIGASHAARAEPDGYTLFAGHVGTLSINPVLYKKLSYEPEKDFAPVTAMVRAPLVLVVNPASSIQTVEQLIEQGKRAEHGLTYSTAGAGSAAHLASELFVAMTGISATHIPYKGSSGATNAIVSGEVDFNFGGQKPSQPLIAANRLRALATTSAERSPQHPSEPVVAETVTGYEVQNWHGIVVPAKTPTEIVRYLNKEITAILNMPDVRKNLAEHGYEAIPMTPEKFGELIAADRTKWKAVIDRAGLSLD
ncbi:tripartite tricarboxylate transporter substrate binding protein [Pusillimonas sp. TS35]|uniref:Bug family tripartite tricarboxylate transporter substrate binding protein n=1 Tax=Paracandidimonas lactea TaxID=2895524 RepID=UPI00136F326A|nr:tripartite tricarboxylate transporter substrate binding protein [Paracandidimonas lactea]MYN14256.1 tripartite tricarboxylate transporter substrate binding protein [Pusillimonas sp. TS35]